MACSEENHLLLYQDAVNRLEEAATECQKVANVDIALMFNSCRGTAKLIEDIKNKEVNPIRLHHQEVLSAKISRLDEAVAGTNSTSHRKVKGTKKATSSDITSKEEPSDSQNQTRRIAIEDTILAKGEVSFDDVAGLEDAKQALKEAIIMPLQFPQLFTGSRKPWRRILLYGPPGTGKSRLAQAVASEIKSTFYSVSSSDLVSSWVGESEKLIKELFHHATSRGNRSVIFMDEIDSVCRRRSSREEEHTRRFKTELLKQMEGADSAHEQVFLLAATNCPWELDPAFLRRFQKRIYIPLPDREARRSLMSIHLCDHEVSMTDKDWQTLVDKTEGFSGSDLATLIMDALFEPIRDLQATAYWTHTPEGKLIPVTAKEPGAFAAKMTELPTDKVEPRQLKVDDFLKALSVQNNTVSKEDLARFEHFSTFGQHT